jgi:hypothetical protein
MTTVSKLTSLHTVLKSLNEMFHLMGMDTWKFGKVGNNWLADRKHRYEDDYTHFIHCSPVECDELVVQQARFRGHESYAPAYEFNDAEDHISVEMESSDWYWDEQVH